MVGGYDFEESKFNRATQAMRQTGSSFKVYVYAEALAQGASPFDTVVDEPVTFRSGGQDYSPHNYDEKFEGRITLRRALADSRNVPAVRLLDKVGIENVIELARKFGITSPLPPYLPLALGAADLTLIEHTSAFTVFPDDGIHIEPHYIRRVTSYDGAVLEEPRPKVTDVIPPDVARTMVAMLEDVVQFGTGVRAKELGRPSAGKTGTTNDFTDAWYIGFTPQTHRRRLGGQRRQAHLARQEGNRRARRASHLARVHAAGACRECRSRSFPNVVPLEKQWRAHSRSRWIRRTRRLPPTPPSRVSPRPRRLSLRRQRLRPQAPGLSNCERRARRGSLAGAARRFSLERIPAARLEGFRASIGADEQDSLAAFDFADRRDLRKLRRLSQALRVPARNGEEQLVIVAAVQRHLQRIQSQLPELRRDFNARNALGPQARAHSARDAQPSEVGRKPVGDVHHG